MTVRLRFCTVEYTPGGCRTVFHDGSETEACAHDTHHYHVASHRAGYGDDILAYAREHEVLHSLTQDWLHDRPSPVLWGVAHGAMLTGRQSAEEEAFVASFARFLRANERPLLSGLRELDLWKAEGLDVIAALERGT